LQWGFSSRGDFNRNNIDTGNVNINRNVNVSVDNEDHYNNGWGGVWYHPVAAGVAIGAVAVTTAAVLGLYYCAAGYRMCPGRDDRSFLLPVWLRLLPAYPVRQPGGVRGSKPPT